MRRATLTFKTANVLAVIEQSGSYCYSFFSVCTAMDASLTGLINNVRLDRNSIAFVLRHGVSDGALHIGEFKAAPAKDIVIMIVDI